MSKEYIEKSVKFRMGKWYYLPFALNEFSWDETINNNFVGRNWRARENEMLLDHESPSSFTEQFKNFKYNLNPGLILIGKDHFEYNKFLIEFGKNAIQIPVGAHNRNSSSKDSILFPMKRSLKDVFNVHAHKDKKYNFNEKKDEIIWRGKFTGRNKNSQIIYEVKDIKNNINEFLRFKFVKKWSQKYNIKFLQDYDWNEEAHWKNVYKVGDSLQVYNKEYVDNYFRENKHMVADWIPFFDWQACHPPKVMDQYKYILSLDGHDWASNVSLILMTNSVMISPIPKWHNIFSLDLAPWEHYVPVLDDASDFEEKLNWCKDHQNECKDIIQRANQYISQFTLDSEAEIAKSIIKRLYKNSKKF